MMSIEAAFSTTTSVLQALAHADFDLHEIRVSVKRDDLIHPLVSGNKWRKLKYSLLQARAQKNSGILTFGGAYSNHLLATAAACHEIGFKSIGIVRGDELHPESNSVLQKCSKLGMELIFIERMEYGMRNDYDYTNELKAEHPGFYVVPEGGANYYGMIGCQEVWRELPATVQHLFVAQGTTATSCGLLLGIPENCTLHVVPVLKGFDAKTEMKKLFNRSGMDGETMDELLQKVVVHDHYHFGGYRKSGEELKTFIAAQNKQFNLPLDEIYTGKAFFAMMDLIRQGTFKQEEIVFLHTGGVHQG